MPQQTQMPHMCTDAYCELLCYFKAYNENKSDFGGLTVPQVCIIFWSSSVQQPRIKREKKQENEKQKVHQDLALIKMNCVDFIKYCWLSLTVLSDRTVLNIIIYY